MNQETLRIAARLQAQVDAIDAELLGLDRQQSEDDQVHVGAWIPSGAHEGAHVSGSERPLLLQVREWRGILNQHKRDVLKELRKLGVKDA